MKPSLVCLALLIGMLTACSDRAQKPPPEIVAPTVIQIGGKYMYLNNGVATVQQSGDNVSMFLTWTPQGAGPHYEVKGKITGNRIEGEWYSHVLKRGWFPFKAEILNEGQTIDFAQTEDPIGVNINIVKLSKTSAVNDPASAPVN